MQEKDISEKILISCPDVFAGIVNAFFKIEGCGDKAKKVEPEDLEDIRGWSFYKATDKIRKQERDVVKLWKTGGVAICLIGIENQTKVDKFMPFRVFSYEGADYREQLSDKNNKKNLYPVITIVLYYGIKQRWNKNKRIFEILKMPEWIRPFVNDCHVNVLELAWLTEEQEKFFDNDMRAVVNFLRQKRENKNYLPTPTELKHYEEFFNLMQALTKERNWEKLWKEAVLIAKEGEKIMIDGIFLTLEKQVRREERAKARKEEREKGREEGREEERENVLKKVKENMLERGYSLDEIDSILALS